MIKSVIPVNVLLESKQGKWCYTASNNCTIIIKGKEFQVEASSDLSEIK